MTNLPYPETRTVDVVDDYHGTPVADPYRWLEDLDAPEVAEWVAAQNRLTRSWLGQVPARDRIRARLAELWDHPRAGAPWRRGRRWFQLRNTGLQNQDVLHLLSSPHDDGRVLLDPNELSADGTVALSGLSVTEDGGRMAYALSEAGSDWMTWRVRDIDRGEDLPDRIVWSKFSSAAWLADGSGFFYAAYAPPRAGEAYEAQNKHQRLHFHRLGTDQAEDVLVEARPEEPEWGFAPQVTEDGRWLIISVWRGTQRENRVHVIDLASDAWEPVALVDTFHAAYDFVAGDGSTLYFLTDHDAPLGKLVAVDLEEPHRWWDVLAEASDALERVRLVGGWFVAVYLHHARHVLRRFRQDGTPEGEIALPGIGAVEAITGRQEDTSLHFTFTSFTSPTAIYRHDLGVRETRQVRPPGLGIEQERFATDQVFVTSGDGTQVPLFLVRRADVTPDGARPVLLYGYGGFNIPLTPMFRVAALVWLELGGVFAVANLRGGGEYGQAWHDAGRLQHKQNVFDDAIACAQWLITSGWTRPQRLAVQGGSNGGLLVGALLTQRPDLFGACVPEVGVLDMLRYHRFTIGWAWASDYGTASDPEQFKTLLAYSPLHNVAPGAGYPATLITTGDHDDRVVPAHSFKFAATLQAAQAPGGPPALIRIETQAGHGAGKPTAKLIDERADVLSFLVRALDMET